MRNLLATGLGWTCLLLVSGALAQPDSAPPSAGFEPVEGAPAPRDEAKPEPQPEPEEAAPSSGPEQPPAAAQPAPAPPPAQPGQPPPGQPPPAGPPYGQPPYGQPPPGYYPPPEPPPPPPPAPEPPRYVSVTFSPLVLIYPMFEVMGEVRIVDGFGVGLFGGLGNWGVAFRDASGEETSDAYPAYQLGGQVHWYPLKPFSGLDVGAEVWYLRIEADEPALFVTALTMRRFAVGPLIGYKLLTRNGFTLLVQGGLQYSMEKEWLETDLVGDLSDERKEWIPLINFNLGWSF